MFERTETVAEAEPFPRLLARTIRARRKELGLTQIELGLLADVSASFLNDVESAKPSVALDRVIRVLDVLGLEPQLALKQAPRALREGRAR